MLEFLFELVFQFLFELVAEILFEAGHKGAARVLRNRWVRYGLAVVVGFGFGVWWGDRLSGHHRPALFWVSLAVAAVAGIGALRRRTDSAAPGEERAVAELRRLAERPTPEAAHSWRTVVDPRRWPAHRLVGLAILNGAVAAGIAVGFEPLR
jgi:hypothetical protein